ncbi:MAG TPA: hypothetical protein PLO51_01905, partial [Candidatus Micrarchaeota archaeon]|nr:hypothetical protein [Candidatus Micrarchaeota archaeon]
LKIDSNLNLTIGTGGISIDEHVSGNGSAQGNDLAACAAISDQQARFSCIANWCGSAARDYQKCYNLTDVNDRLGCLGKCSPSFIG